MSLVCGGQSLKIRGMVSANITPQQKEIRKTSIFFFGFCGYIHLTFVSIETKDDLNTGNFPAR